MAEESREVDFLPDFRCRYLIPAQLNLQNLKFYWLLLLFLVLCTSIQGYDSNNVVIAVQMMSNISIGPEASLRAPETYRYRTSTTLLHI